MPQTTVNLIQKVGYEGQLVTDNFASIRGAYRPFYNKTGALLPYGRIVCLDTGSKTNLILPNTTGLTPVGITIFNEYDQGFPLADSTLQGYKDDYLVAVLVKGAADILVYSSTAVDIDDPVYFRHANGVAGNMGVAGLGTVRNSTDADYTLWSGARFVSKTSGAGVAAINIGGY